MHSSRMTTVRCSGRLGRGGVWPEGRGGGRGGWCLPRGYLPRGVSARGCLPGVVSAGGGGGYLHVCPGGVSLEWCLPGVVAGRGGICMSRGPGGGVVSAQ